eukprot:CAMPEP_0179447950 /NCGR_PEP_ID=MMETSP0799-20121207/31737_1 /TAXON_ID=46947 /ORGANISM="Geminigera cryophila, Strain CCMP2564" /LENGTH=40 /DNA_ID= /DNA_START= /DNA_END= /DNA_ORIENTATION=
MSFAYNGPDEPLDDELLVDEVLVWPPSQSMVSVPGAHKPP